MDTPVRKYQKQKDYQRHKLFRKMKRRRRAAIEQAKDAPMKQLRRKLKIPKFEDGKDKNKELPYPLRSSKDYDDNLAYQSGIIRDPKTGHMWSTTQEEYPDERTYLKKPNHPTFNKALWGDLISGYDVYFKNGNTYSAPTFSELMYIKPPFKFKMPKFEDGKDDKPNVFQLADGTFVNSHNEPLEVLDYAGVEDPTKWTYVDKKGNRYTPKASRTLTEGEQFTQRQIANEQNTRPFEFTPYIEGANEGAAMASLMMGFPFNMAGSAYYGARGLANAYYGDYLDAALDATGAIAPAGSGIWRVTKTAANNIYNRLPWTYRIPENPNMAYRRMGPLERDWIMEGNELGTRDINPATELEREAAVAAERAKNPNRRFVLFKAGAEHGGRKQFAKGQPWAGTTVTHGEEQVLAIPGEDLPWVSGRHYKGPQGVGFKVGEVPFEEAPFGSHIDLLTEEGYTGVNPSLLDGSVIYSPYKIFGRNFGYKKLYPSAQKKTPWITAENAANITPAAKHPMSRTASQIKEYVDSPKDITSDVGELIAEGSERSVYSSKTNPNIVYKIEDGNAALENINNIKIRSEITDDIIAPETTIGYYKHKNGKYYRVTQQDKYKSFDPDNYDVDLSPELNQEIINTLEKAGWKVEIVNGTAKTASKNGKVLRNLEHYNWGIDSKGNLKLIDQDAIESSKPLLITSENASSITPAQWTAAQDMAVRRGDMAEAQRLRDLHSSLTDSATPGKYYRGTQTKRNSYLDRHVDEEVGEMNGIYLTKKPKYAKTYGDVEEFYLRSNNPLETEGSWTGVIDDATRAEIENAGYDAVVNNRFDTGFLNKLLRNSRDETITFNGKNLKLADAITYGPDGTRIPLGSRDNFNINDIRYGLLAPLAGGTALLGYNSLGQPIDTYKHGKDSGIHINPKNRGKFNALKKRTGKTTEQLTHSKNPLTRKRAIFAQNAKKFKH